MQLVVKGKNMEINSRLRAFVDKKVSRFERVLPNLAEAEVELSTEGPKNADARYVAQVTVKVNGAVIRAEQHAGDTYSAVDVVMDKLDRQISRFKSKKLGAYNKAGTESRGPAAPEEALPFEEEEEPGQLVRTKRFAVKPMDVEEALENMELLGHDFYVFRDSRTQEIAVVYRRKDGNFGLIQPE